MSYIITDDKHYKNIAKSIRSKMQTDREYYPEDMAVAVDNIPSSADGTDNPITGIYFLNPDENGYPTKIKVSGWSLENKETKFPIVFNDKIFSNVESVEFLSCDFKYLFDRVFENMNVLNTVALPDSITSIVNYAFNCCSSLTSITIPNSVTSIGSYAFNNCSSLTSVTIPNSVTSIGNYAFNNCSSLTSITIPNSVTIIDSGAFSNCFHLANIIIPDSVTSIGIIAFQSCRRLVSIAIPNSVTSIGGNAFNGCTLLENVTLGYGFNANNLDLSPSNRYTRETILQWLNALSDRTGQTAYKLTIGKTNLAKLTEEDIAIATAKNWTLA